MKKMTGIALSLGVLAVLVPGSLLAQSPPPLPAAPPPPMPAAPTGAQYYYNNNGQQAGPFTADQIKQMIASGQISLTTLVWKSGTPSWVAAGTLPEFANAGGGGGGSAVAGGCNGTEFFSDDFSQTTPDQTLTPEGTKLKFKALAGKFDFFTYRRVLSGDADICVTAQVPHVFKSAGDTFAGVIFGGNEGGDFEAFLINPNGNSSMLRWVNKNLDLPIAWHKADSLNPAPGAKNKLRVSVRGNTATFYVNDMQFATFNGPLPNGAGKLGVIVKSEPGRRDAWKFADFKATSPQ